MVFYRKYRPQTIAELDSPKLRETLVAILSSKNIPHAFLFTGPKGLGKTSTARIIAKILNCEKNALSHEHSEESRSKILKYPSTSLRVKVKDDSSLPCRQAGRQARTIKDIEPCNVCLQCVSITNGQNIDVLEIDGASNRGIDEIRELRERVNLAPSAARKKVYIIDEVHMLTTEAFNALLKTIEEPPSHVVFIFATTEPQKVPSTILSRCFHIPLQKATEEELLHSLKRIVDTEKIAIDEPGLRLIAKLGDGGFRDTQKLFEEIVALSGGKKIDKDFIESHYHITDVSLDIQDLFESLKQRNATSSLAKIEILVTKGTSLTYFLEQILQQLHIILLRNVGVEKEKVNPKLPEFSFEEISLLVELFSESFKQIKYAVIPSLPLELAVVEFCQLSNDSLSVISAQAGIQSFDSTQAKKDAPIKSGIRSVMTIHDAFKKEQNLKIKRVLSGTGLSDIPKAGSTQENLPKDVKDTAVLLENLIYKVKPYNHSIAGVLRSCSVQSVTDTAIVFSTAYAFHKERLDDMKSKEILEKALKEITGKVLKTSVVLKKKE